MSASFFDWHLTSLQIPIFVTLLMCSALAVYVGRQRTSPLGETLMWGIIACALWSFFRLLSYLSVTIAAKHWWDNAEYLGIVSVPVLTFIFALQYTGHRHWITRRTLVGVSIIPLLTLGLVWSSGFHQWVRTQQFVAQTRWGEMPYATYGPWFWLHTAYSYGLILAGSLLILNHLFQTPRAYRWQAVYLVLAVMTPLLANLGFLTGVQPAWLDFTPSAFAISMALLTWDLFRLQLLNVVPIARRMIFDNLKDGLIVLTQENRVADINPAAAHIFALDYRHSLGHKLEELFVSWQEFVELCDKNEEKSEIMLESVTSGPRWFQVQIELLHPGTLDRNGKVILLYDITERKQNEQALAIARDEAMTASKIKTQLLAKVSHELRTPLSVIFTYSELLSNNAIYQRPDKQIAAARTINSYTRYLSKLVDDLLDSAQLDVGTLLLKSAPFSPAQLIERVYQGNVDDARHKGIQFTHALDSQLPPMLLGDPDRLFQILNNLVSNAIKFTNQGSVQIDLCCTSATQWMLKVSDSGPGIPAEALNAIFEPFQKLETSTAGKNQGYGLGLAIVHQLSQLMGGEVLVESDLGKGTTFKVLLPLELNADRSE
ncbi:MAG: histidine kinase N-terminal 7TM domain-containing protein [Caldilineaceae bacterium]